MEQNLHLTGTVTDFAFGVGITAFIQIGHCWRSGRLSAFGGSRWICDASKDRKVNPRQRCGGRVRVHRGPPPGSRPVINSCMVFTWTEILPAAIRSLPPLHQEIVGHVMELPAGTSEGTHRRDRRGTWTVTPSTRSLDVRLPLSVYTFGATASPALPIWRCEVYGVNRTAPGRAPTLDAGYASPAGRMAGLDRRWVYRRLRWRYR